MCASIYTYVRDLGKVGVLFLKEHFPCINCINPYEMFIEQKKKIIIILNALKLYLACFNNVWHT